MALTGVAGLALRVWTYRSAAGVPDSDEAVVGLMARHILHGQFTTFFWGQGYGGSQEALLTAPIFAVFGSSWLALRLVPIALSAVTALLVWRVGLRLMGERAGGSRSGHLLDLAPVPDLQAHAPVGLLRQRRPVLRPAHPAGAPCRRAAEHAARRLLGLVLGLAGWETAQIVPVAVPLLLWMGWKSPRWLRKLWIVVPAAMSALSLDRLEHPTRLRLVPLHRP